jgi:hypothetical protein
MGSGVPAAAEAEASVARRGQAVALLGDPEKLHRQLGMEADRRTAAATASKPYPYRNRQERNRSGSGGAITFHFFSFSSIPHCVHPRVAVCSNSKQLQGYRRVPVRIFMDKLGKLGRIGLPTVSSNRQKIGLTMEIR